ncbi:MAG: glycoside hydrolase family 25 protein [Clostridia bacterium]|nr:glycoside hydrolase family 25 protein [Clostridia bacterium]
MSTTFGIDVSEYQSEIDWEKVKAAGKTFAILRCGYGRYESQIDRRFLENYKNAKAAGVHVGAYLFSYAVTPEQAREEAHNCLALIRGKRFEYPIVYDVETAAQRKLGKEKLSANVQAFCETMEQNGCYVSLYSNLDFLRNVLTTAVTSRYDIWLAQWASKPTYTGAFGMWQYSATGRVNGIRGAVDLDAAYKDYPAIMRRNGLNGFPAVSRRSTEPYVGMALELADTPLYVSSDTPYASGRLNGTYYLYDTQTVNGRCRVTDRRGFAGIRPAALFVTGWIDASVLE